jgi:hypothetical protein
MINLQEVLLVRLQMGKVKPNRQMKKDDMQMKKIFNWLFIFCLPIFFACNNTRHIPKGDALYTGARVNLKGTDLSMKRKKVLLEDLHGLTRPSPTPKFWA